MPTVDTEYNCSDLNSEYRKLQREGDSCICHINPYLGEMSTVKCIGAKCRAHLNSLFSHMTKKVLVSVLSEMKVGTCLSLSYQDSL